MNRVILLSALVFLLSYCNPTNKKKDAVEVLGSTKSIIMNDIKFVFDLVSIDDQKKMAMRMKSPYTPAKDANRHITLTLLNQKTLKLIKEESVTLAVFDETGQKVADKVDVISGEGMHHYGVDFVANKGKYRFKASVILDGKTSNAEVDYQVQSL